MSIFKHIDREKVVGFLAFYWWAPFGEWFIGIPDEPMFLHEVLKLGKNTATLGISAFVPAFQFTTISRNSTGRAKAVQTNSALISR
jgi:hypothetical protein